jgi:linoleoyl-CoA desaturase
MINPKTVHFDPSMSSEFFNTLRTRIDDYFKETGQSKKANGLMVFKSVFFTTWVLASYFSLLLIPDLSTGAATLLFILFGLGAAFFIVSIGHDASHGAYSANPIINKLLSYSWNIVGISSYMWAMKHNMSHHSFTNVPGSDPDISQNRLLRLNPDYDYKPFYRFQHIYAIFLFALMSVFLVYIKDFMLYRQKVFGNKVVERHPTKEWIILFVSKAFYITYSLVIPLVVLPFAWWQILLMHLAGHAVAGIALALMLVPPHINPHTVYTSPDSTGTIKNCWAKHQIESTIDLSAESFLINWFTGGLNTHVIHHLFPHICHIHYRKLSPIVRKTAEEYGINYVNLPLLQAMRDHFYFLKELGRHPEAYHSRVMA